MSEAANETNRATVKTAVQNEHVRSRQGFLQRLFAVWFDAFVYNQIWEDPRVDLQALRLAPDSRVLTISSGGCNALNYLLADPASVTAVDLNRHHIYLLELKIAALRHLPRYEDFFEFFGFGSGKNTQANYLRYIAPHLNPEARKFWESNTLGGGYLYGQRISFFRDRGLYEHSRNGYFLRVFHRLGKLLGGDPSRLLDANSLEEQRELYDKHVDPFFDSLIARALGKIPVTTFGLGIPPQQHDELKTDLKDGETIIDIYRERVRKLACDFPIDDNYFAWQAFSRKYDTDAMKALPEYLKLENYEHLKANADRIHTHIGSATDIIKHSPAATFDRFVFLDAQDWMNADQKTELWSAIAEKAESGSRIIFRTAGAASPIETDLPAELRSRFVYEEAVSRELFKEDRASIYGGFHLYVLK